MPTRQEQQYEDSTQRLPSQLERVILRQRAEEEAWIQTSGRGEGRDQGGGPARSRGRGRGRGRGGGRGSRGGAARGRGRGREGGDGTATVEQERRKLHGAFQMVLHRLMLLENRYIEVIALCAQP